MSKSRKSSIRKKSKLSGGNALAEQCASLGCLNLCNNTKTNENIYENLDNLNAIITDREKIWGNIPKSAPPPLPPRNGQSKKRQSKKKQASWWRKSGQDVPIGMPE